MAPTETAARPPASPPGAPLPAPLASPLAGEHRDRGARLVEFAGWQLPVQFAGIVAEHRAVRTAAGLFDISHMGQIEVTGPASAAWLDTLLSNDGRLLTPGQGQYTLLLNDRGGVIDDLLLYRLGPEESLLVVNAARTAEVAHWLRAHPDRSTSWRLLPDRAAVALQGPQAPAIFARAFPAAGPLPGRNEIRAVAFADAELLVAGTGYTGETGCEVFGPATAAVPLWRQLLAAGAPLGLAPCGLGARDILRLEMCYPLNGADLTPDRTPLEAGLGRFAALAKPEFVGRDTLLAQHAAGVRERLTPLRATGKPVPWRAGYPVCDGAAEVGTLTSGTLSPTLGVGIGLAYLPVALARPDRPLAVAVRGHLHPAVVARKPFFKPS